MSIDPLESAEAGTDSREAWGAGDGPQVFSVSEVTRVVRGVIESALGVVWVEGEVSNYRKQASGHQYFTLKDAQSQLSCVLFARGGSWRKQVPLADGMQVQVRGALTVYEARGQYQLNVQLVQAGGAGLLQAKFEALKRKLDAEGLFDPARKRPLPRFPATVALVTSPTGAALRDILNILERRAPWLRVLVSPVRVQGAGAGKELAAAVAELNQAESLGLPRPDVLVVTRGGGSMEDLWEFNDESLARAIAASQIPVVSAVGHEIDFTIADFVSDLRAPTPSAAAELVAPDTGELLRRLGQTQAQLQRSVLLVLERVRNRVAYLSRAALFSEPTRRLDAAAQRLDLAQDALGRAARDRVSREVRRVGDLCSVVRAHRPDQLIGLRRQQLGALERRLSAAVRQRLAERQQRLQRGGDMLRLLAPQTVLERGFSITTLADGRLIPSVKGLVAGTQLITRLIDGTVESVVGELG